MPINLTEAFEDTFIDSKTREYFTTVHKNETEEVLDNLGYIRMEEKGNRVNSTLTDIDKGIRQFREEYREFRTAFRTAIAHPGNPSAGVASARSARAVLNEEELEFLHTITSLEGDFDLHHYSMEQIFRNKILSRILLWRLTALSLISGAEPDLPADTISILGKLMNWTGTTTLPEVLALSGNIHELSLAIASQPDYKYSSFNHMAYFRSNSGRNRLRNGEKWFTLRLDFLPETSRKHFAKTSEKASLIEKMESDELNQVMIRLFQLKLWTMGIYDGKLDSIIGERSIRAIELLDDFLNSNFPNDALQITNFIKPLKSDFFALNTHYLFVHFFPRFLSDDSRHEKKTHETLSEHIGGILGISSDPEKELILKEIELQINEHLETDKKSKRKIKNRESKRVFPVIVRFFRKICNSIGKGIGFVIEQLKRFFSWFRNGAMILLRELKKIYHMVLEAFAFFFSNRIVSTSGITCDFDSNFDCLVTITNANPDQIDEIIRKNSDRSQSLHEVADFLGTVLSYALKVSTGIFGWIQLGIEVIRHLARNSFSYNRLAFG